MALVDVCIFTAHINYRTAISGRLNPQKMRSEAAMDMRNGVVECWRIALVDISTKIVTVLPATPNTAQMMAHLWQPTFRLKI